MKRELLNPKLLLTAAAAATLLTGCASVDRGYSDVNGPSPALAFTTVTDPNQMIKWTGDRFLQMSLRSVDTYYFQVPDTGYNPGGMYETAGRPATYTTGTGSSDLVTRDSYGRDVTSRDLSGSVRGPYQSETRSYKTIQYRPGHSL